MVKKKYFVIDLTKGTQYLEAGRDQAQVCSCVPELIPGTMRGYVNVPF